MDRAGRGAMTGSIGASSASAHEVRRRAADWQPGFEALWCSPAAQDLLARAGRELAAAERTGDPSERFVRAHLCALRTAAAVLAVRGRPATRGRTPTVWELLTRAAPDLRAWAAYFAAGSDLRAAIESGRRATVPQEQADHVLSMARMFLGAVQDPSLARAS